MNGRTIKAYHTCRLMQRIPPINREFDDWDIKYATWNTITVDIPGFMKGSGGSIQFRAATFFAGAIGDGGEFNDSYYTG